MILDFKQLEQFFQDKTRMLVFKSKLDDCVIAARAGFRPETMSEFMNHKTDLCSTNMRAVVIVLKGSHNGYFDITEAEEKEYLKTIT